MSRFLLPGMLSAFSKNHCPDCAGISVRFKQESLSVFSKNAVRNQQESLSGLGKNMQPGRELGKTPEGNRQS